MGLTKQYLRYVPEASFGVVGSPTGDAFFVKFNKSTDRYIAVPACEHVIVWDTRLGTQVLRLLGDKHSVTSLVPHPVKEIIAVGYSDGSVKSFSLAKKGECLVTLNGHKSAVVCLTYDQKGMRLASGGKDTEIVLWDVVNESGLFRLKGHKGIVTCLQFLKDRNVIVSSSKDMLIKFWDLDTQHCFKTVVGHRTEIWSFVLLESSQRLVTGSGDSELRVYQLAFKDTLKNEDDELEAKKAKLEEDDDDDDSVLSCIKVGTILRQGRDRVFSIKVDRTQRVIACHGSDSLLEFFQISNEEEIRKRLQRKRKKKRQKLEESKDDMADEDDEEISVALSDEVKRLTGLKAAGKIRAFDLRMKKDNLVQVLVLLNNNSIQLFRSCFEHQKENHEESSFIRLPGHRTDVRTVAFSSDNYTVLTASAEALKIWSRSSQQCICTIACDYALCSTFAPGDRHCIIGTKSGKLQVFDISSGNLLQTIDAHESEVWSLTLSSDLRGVITGSADKDVKFWDFELIRDDESSDSQKRLSLSHQRTLKMTEDVLCVRISKDMKLFAVSLLDSTVKVFFVDSLKFFLSLYGHKFPVLCMDMSDDGTLLVTGSADKNIKIWGLDFGDCHKSIFAHQESIMCVQFIPRTHMFFSAAKDRTIKQWDADNFQKITTLEGHQGEVWALAVSPNGKHLCSASHDKSLRLWLKTDEPLVLEEEQEMEREAEYEKSAVGEEPVVPGETNEETGLAGKKSIETIAAAERLIEAIDVFNEVRDELENHKEECRAIGKELPLPKVNPLLEAYNTTCPLRFMMEALKRVKSSEMEKSLLVLPFTYVSDLLYIFSLFLDKGWETELCSRCLFFLLRVHCNQIMATHSLITVVDKLKVKCTAAVKNLRDSVGFNLAGMQFLQREVESNEVVLFAEATQKFKDKKRKRRKKERVIIHIE